MATRTRLLMTAVAVGLLAAFLSLRSSNVVEPAPVVRGKNNTVLFLVAEHPGFSNVHHATASALLERHPEVAVHFASFPRVEKEANLTSHFARRRNPEAAPVIFHTLPGPSYTEAIENTGMDMEEAVLPRGLDGLLKMLSQMQLYLSPWTAEDHLKLVDASEAIIQEVDPAIVVLDSMFCAGIDAARKSNRLTAVVSPNMASDTFVDRQPWGQMFWRYPVYGSLLLRLIVSAIRILC